MSKTGVPGRSSVRDIGHTCSYESLFIVAFTTLANYNDGRWVLKQVNWGFDTGVKGTVEIR